MVFGAIGAVATDLSRPVIFKYFFDFITKPSANAEQLLTFIWLLLAVGIANLLLWRIISYSSIPFTSRILNEIANDCFAKLHSRSYNFFNNSFVGSLVAKVNRFTNSYERIFDTLAWSMGPTTIKMIIILIVLTVQQPIMAMIVLAWGIIYLAINFTVTAYKLKYDIETAKAESNATAHLADTIGNQINLKLFSSASYEGRVYAKHTGSLKKAREKTWYLDAHLQTFQTGMMVTLEFIILYTAVILWERGLFSVGDFVLIQAYLLHIFRDLWGVGKHIRRIYEALADANEMTEVLLTPQEIMDKPNAITLKARHGKIDFKNVTFGYTQKRPVFTNFNLTVTPGERIALIGPSGGGKSTTIKLLFRFFDIQEGEILIDGQNITNVTQDSLRSQLALVPQDPILFHRSLLENIRYARPKATKAEVVRATKLAHCHEFIMNFPDGYDTYVGERGVKLSGGERQRVAIARAILKNAPILVLDEATSSLDSQSERYIQDALRSLMRDRTTIVIAHRLSTIVQMDRIVVIEDGKIIEQGKHQELLKVKKGIYQKLWDIQVGSFNETNA